MKLGPNDLALVTGATGFIGGRLVEHLVARGVRVRVATSDLRNCSRVARFPVELRKADLRNPGALDAVVAGCSVVFHCGYSFGGDAAQQLRTNFDGTRALAEAALAHGVRRLIHFSSVAAYGPTCDGKLDEKTVAQRGDDYTNTKHALEQMLLELHRARALPVAILQPTIVYGPFGFAWTTRLIEQVRDYRVALPRAGQGVCNAVYVDDVVQAALLAAERDAAAGQRFLVSGPAPVTWGEFYRGYAAIADRADHVLALDDDAFARAKAAERKRHSLPHQARSFLSRRPAFRDRVLAMPPLGWALALGRFALPTRARDVVGARYDRLWQMPPEPDVPTFFPDPGNEALFRAGTAVDIGHARATLGYAPEFDLARGMALCGAWAKWANLLAPSR